MHILIENAFVETDSHIQGTAAQLIRAGLKVNGTKLMPADIGQLCNMGACEMIATATRPVGSFGKNPKVYRFSKTTELFFGTEARDIQELEEAV